MNKLFLGGDVSKGYTDFIILDSRKTIIEDVFQLDDTFEGHSKLYEIISTLLKNDPDAILYAGLESTGGLENNWYNFLFNLANILNVKIARINPIGPHNLQKASLERNGSDAISARYIAEYMIAFPEKVSYNVDDPYVALRKQWNFIETMKKQKTQLLNQLSLYIYEAFPFLSKYCRKGIPNWLLQLLIKYPSASKLAKARGLNKIPYISNKRAQSIVGDAKQSVGSADDETTAFVIKAIVGQILIFKKTIETHKEHMIKSCELKEVDILTSYPGIGVYSAIGLILNIISIERFPSAKHLASYFGVHPKFKISGDKTSGVRMSKTGRSEPRKILFMIVRSAIIYNPLIREVYARHLQRGKSKMFAIGVCMHKTLRVVYGMLKHQKKFDKKIDDEKQKCSNMTEKKIKEMETKRRFQEESEDAPISYRQKKQRKERKQTQLDSIETFGLAASSSLSKTF